jgi:hypothetical protein
MSEHSTSHTPHTTHAEKHAPHHAQVATPATLTPETPLANTLFSETAERMVHNVVASAPVSKMTFTPQGLEISFVHVPEALQDKLAVPGVQFPAQPSKKALDQYRALNDAGLTMGIDQRNAVAQKLKQQAEAAQAVASTPTELASQAPEGQAITISPEAQAAVAQAMNSPAQQAVVEQAGITPPATPWAARIAAQQEHAAAQGPRQI